LSSIAILKGSSIDRRTLE